MSRDDQPDPKPFAINLEDEANPRIRQTFEYWKGTNSFLLSGKIVLGPEDDTLLAKLFIILIGLFSFIFYFVFLPQTPSRYYHPLLAAFSVSLLLFSGFYILTAIVEPGYLPHQNLLRVPETLNVQNEINQVIIKTISGTFDYTFNGLNNINPSSNRRNGSGGVDRGQGNDPNASQQIKENNDDQHEAVAIDADQQAPAQAGKYCVYCKVYKLERTAHCSKCNACVRVFDHHCSLANNCVGKRNYKYFLGMVVSGLVLTALFVTALVFFYLASSGLNSGAYRFFFVVMGVHCLFAFCFCLFHLSLCLFMGKTTKEFMSGVSSTGKSTEKWDWFWKSDSLINFKQLIPADKANWLVDTY